MTPCKVCSAPIVGRRADALFCTDRCGNRFWRTQAAMQMRRRARGECTRCGEAPAQGGLCDRHAKLRNGQARVRERRKGVTPATTRPHCSGCGSLEHNIRRCRGEMERGPLWLRAALRYCRPVKLDADKVSA